MSYRDDRDALLAQAEALRQENERLQAENRKLREPPPAKPPPPEPKPPRKPLLSHHGKRQLKRFLFGLALGVAGLFLLDLLWEGCKAIQPGRTDKVIDVMILDDGTVAVFRSRHQSGKASSTTYELASHDPVTGKGRAVELYVSGSHDGEYRLYPRAGDLAWALRPDGKLELLDLRAPAKQLEVGALAAAVPALADGYKVEAPSVSPYEAPLAALPVELRDGSRRYLDMTPALVDDPPPRPPWRPGFYCGPDMGAKPSCERRECLAFASVEGTSALVLATQQTWDTQDWRSQPLGGAAATRMLRPGLVKLVETECAFEHDGAALVVHDSAAIEPIEPLLSLVGRDGVARWTVPTRELVGAPREALGAVTVDGELRVFLTTKQRTTLELVRMSPDGEVLGHARLL